MGPQRVRRDGATKYGVAQHSTAAYLLLNRKASQRPRTNWPPFHIREFWGQERFLEKSHFLWDTSIYLSAACKELEELYDPDEPGKPPSGVDTGGGRTWRQDPNLSASALLVCMCVPTHMHTLPVICSGAILIHSHTHTHTHTVKGISTQELRSVSFRASWPGFES